MSTIATTKVSTIPSATISRQTAVINAPLDTLWKLIRSCTFGWQKIVTACEVENNVIGSTKSIQYRDNTTQIIQITQISDINHTLCWSMIASEPPVSYTSRDDTICLIAITVPNAAKHQTVMTWTSEFSNDSNLEVIMDSNLKKREAFSDLIAYFSIKKCLNQTDKDAINLLLANSWAEEDVVNVYKDSHNRLVVEKYLYKLRRKSTCQLFPVAITEIMSPKVTTKSTGFRPEKLSIFRTGKPQMILLGFGSYSPVTYLHLIMFETARNYLMHKLHKFDIIGGLLSPVHDGYGKTDLLPAEHRLNMCRLATYNSDWISASDWEVKQEKWTTTKAALESYAKMLKKYIDPFLQVRLLCGGDLLESMTTQSWTASDVEEIISKYGIVCIDRLAAKANEIVSKSPLLSKYKDNIDIVPVITNNISSSLIRKTLRNGSSIKYLTPDKVVDYIYRFELFGVTRPFSGRGSIPE